MAVSLDHHSAVTLELSLDAHQGPRKSVLESCLCTSISGWSRDGDGGICCGSVIREEIPSSSSSTSHHGLLGPSFLSQMKPREARQEFVAGNALYSRQGENASQ